jgi:CTP:phosphocholine cytidylyltransferase-like protein
VGGIGNLSGEEGVTYTGFSFFSLSFCEKTERFIAENKIIKANRTNI